ncbi:DUF982 domain-containing protein [Mesorhizobium sp. KR1-2]|uniref:DUF982 domain-containing protein n=1 Tax=Mesorhizobium sp. KR1-2 TaxID=3156609 RepID=UPI0032B43E3E
MNTKRFTQPVAIFVGLGFPRDVDNVWEAYEALIEWNGNRGPMHAMALNVCRSALTNETDVDAARIAFIAFARSRGILVPDAHEESTSRAAEEWLAA